MNYRDSLMTWSFSVGVWFATDVYITWLFPALFIVFCWWWGITLGLVFGTILLVSTLLHEFGHVLGARSTGGDGYEVFIYPLGGLASVYPGYSLWSKLFTTAAGPLVNLALCVMAFPAVIHSKHYYEAVHPLILPAVQFSTGEVISDVLVLIFSANYILFLINILPIYPLDGGRMVQTILIDRLGRNSGTAVYYRVGLFLGIGIMLLGVLLPEATPGRIVGMVVLLGAILTICNMQESMQFENEEMHDDPYLNEDYADLYPGITSTKTSVQKKPGFFKRWREKKRLEKEIREQKEIELEEVQVDALLDKVHKQGLDSLTSQEKRILERASSRRRKNGN